MRWSRCTVTVFLLSRPKLSFTELAVPLSQAGCSGSALTRGTLVSSPVVLVSATAGRGGGLEGRRLPPGSLEAVGTARHSSVHAFGRGSVSTFTAWVVHL